ncbi:hypothetical protein N7508_002319 [Penicillium antarcticum]|uniref:uncharacterized protein n=1 Tax=Penicillium antarcticum TaxID=416450 RepID=UPI002384C9A1|nr:uncharacterized protein N7508_002319 [Penicillium antarcticum]KAJ5317811.1 hypothetical protein N7508_002319 [Penicillium antarcticum]
MKSPRRETLHSIYPQTSTFLSNPPSHEAHNDQSHHGQSSEENINLKHMELLIHLTTNKDTFSLGLTANDDSTGSELAFALKTSLESPYLLHQLLAFSARHLAYLHPDRPDSYLHQAVTLQTSAASLFTAVGTEVNQSNCVAVLLFSSILGHQLLADTLAKRPPEGLDEFMTSYVQFVEMHRGIHTIAMTAWPQLMKTELEPILSWSSQFTAREPRGHDCQQVRELIVGSKSLLEDEKKTCLPVIDYLQVGFDAVSADEEQGNRHHMLCTWPMLGSSEFTALLAAKQHEALVILAYYALLLHHGRHLWQVQDAGVYMLQIITVYLGTGWDYWLEYPRRGIFATK